MKFLITALAVAIAMPALAQPRPPAAPNAPPVQPSWPDVRAAAAALGGMGLRYEACLMLVQDPLLRQYGITADSCLKLAEQPPVFAPTPASTRLRP